MNQEANKLHHIIENTKDKIMKTHKEMQKIKPFYNKCIEKWKYFQLRSVSMKQMTASMNEHIQIEIQYYKKYRQKLRKKTKHHIGNHKWLFQSVHQEMKLYFSIYIREDNLY